MVPSRSSHKERRGRNNVISNPPHFVLCLLRPRVTLSIRFSSLPEAVFAELRIRSKTHHEGLSVCVAAVGVLAWAARLPSVQPCFVGVEQLSAPDRIPVAAACSLSGHRKRIVRSAGAQRPRRPCFYFFEMQSGVLRGCDRPDRLKQAKRPPAIARRATLLLSPAPEAEFSSWYSVSRTRQCIRESLRLPRGREEGFKSMIRIRSSPFGGAPNPSSACRVVLPTKLSSPHRRTSFTRISSPLSRGLVHSVMLARVTDCAWPRFRRWQLPTLQSLARPLLSGPRSLAVRQAGLHRAD